MVCVCGGGGEAWELATPQPMAVNRPGLRSLTGGGGLQLPCVHLFKWGPHLNKQRLIFPPHTHTPTHAQKQRRGFRVGRGPRRGFCD